uniref:(northern house mosquito) hypothetical protein n=1 Tax=Culex pipiens TaxID=7175 RepID=A0A8D8N0V1_CULPI
MIIITTVYTVNTATETIESSRQGHADRGCFSTRNNAICQDTISEFDSDGHTVTLEVLDSRTAWPFHRNQRQSKVTTTVTFVGGTFAVSVYRICIVCIYHRCLANSLLWHLVDFLQHLIVFRIGFFVGCVRIAAGLIAINFVAIHYFTYVRLIDGGGFGNVTIHRILTVAVLFHVLSQHNRSLFGNFGRFRFQHSTR